MAAKLGLASCFEKLIHNVAFLKKSYSCKGQKLPQYVLNGYSSYLTLTCGHLLIEKPNNVRPKFRSDDACQSKFTE